MGKTIAHYTVGEKLGAGGMGVVYQATDTKLNREVALKVLPDEFAQDSTRMARFKREAQVLASLNHPNIAAIHGLEQEGDTQAIAMELVDGLTLAERIKQGAVPLEEALNIAKQIAEALESAHEQGVIHRDLKPANVKVKEDGTVKVLDFGLAKALEDPQSDPDMSNSPTLSVAATKAGIILGTAAYMSPEQARGQTVDKRADIWSFGVVLFEMLTGKRAFEGQTTSDILARVLTAELDFDSLPPDTPPPIRKLLRRCLSKDRKNRLRDIGDARVEIEEALSGATDIDGDGQATATSPHVSLWQRVLPWGVLGLFGLAIVLALTLAPRNTEAPLLKFELRLADSRFLYWFPPKLSPDGRKIFYRNDGKLWVREIDRVEPREIPGGDNSVDPFWSHDSEWVAYFEGSKLWKAPAGGGERSIIAELPAGVPGGVGGGIWMPDGRIIYTAGNSGLLVVSAQGGDAETYLEVAEGEQDFHDPVALPDGRTALFVVHRDQGSDTLAVFDGSERKMILRLEGNRLWNPAFSSTGHILYERSGINDGLWALPFSLSRLASEGEPFMVDADGAYPSASLTGSITYVTGENTDALAQFAWLDRDGNISKITDQQEPLSAGFSLSPDGKRIVYSAGDSGNEDLWIYDTERGTRTRLTFEDGEDWGPTWHPDGENVVYHARGEGLPAISTRRADGTGKRVKIVDGAGPVYSPDGRYLLFNTSDKLDYLALGESQDPVVLVAPGTLVAAPRVSPDGEYIAYFSMESGRPEVYMKRFPSGEGRWQVSVNGGMRSQWSPDGRRLYYRSGDDIFEVPVTTRPALRLGSPRKVFTHNRNQEVPPGSASITFVVSPDGQRVLLAILAENDSDDGVEDQGTPVIFIQNWIAEFQERE